ncbi:hypothetical protein F2P44_20040 [Massilia sp. CCM 8695]|uniref:Uncharacterized protein n=1 Tax=Massilia frigida TaxID=2609281 RepID=A0ABX0NJD8_9BURK|nr:hypothetical protein [Massilia frigida]NHZ81550.1 hypothetical protein [Massilia frigida]
MIGNAGRNILRAVEDVINIDNITAAGPDIVVAGPAIPGFPAKFAVSQRNTGQQHMPIDQLPVSDHTRCLYL